MYLHLQTSKRRPHKKTKYIRTTNRRLIALGRRYDVKTHAAASAGFLQITYLFLSQITLVCKLQILPPAVKVSTCIHKSRVGVDRSCKAKSNIPQVLLLHFQTLSVQLSIFLSSPHITRRSHEKQATHKEQSWMLQCANASN